MKPALSSGILLLLALPLLAGAQAKPDQDKDMVLFMDGVALDLLVDPVARPGYELKAPSMALVPDQAQVASQRLHSQGDQIPPEAARIIRDDLERANRMARERRWPEALHLAEQALALEPRHPDLLRRCATYASLSGQFALAEGYFREVNALVPDRAELLAGWGANLLRLGRVEEAREVCNRALLISPNNLMVRFNHLLVELMSGEESEPGNFWIALPMRQVDILVSWLVSDRSALEPHTGSDVYARVIQTTLGLRDAGELMDFQEALGGIRQAYNDGDTATYQKNLERLLALQERPSLSFLMEKSRLLLNANRLEDALAVTRDTQALYPENPWGYYNHGFVLVQMADYGGARTAFLKALDMAPDSAPVQFALACAYAGEQQMEKAWPILEALTGRHPEHMPTWMEGEADYLKAIREDPRYPALAGRFKQPDAS